MKRLLLLTSNFPYYPGEQFIELEVAYLARRKEISICVAPSGKRGNPRILPKNVDMELGLTSSFRFEKALYLPLALLSKIFWIDIANIAREKKIGCAVIMETLKITALVLFHRKRLKNVIEKNGGFDIVYCYWNDVQSYASVLLKRKGLIDRVYSRAHGYDLYEGRRRGSYMPLKKQFILEYDLLLPISEHGKNYLIRRYGVDERSISLSRLGVSTCSSYTPCSGRGKLNILSISLCLPVKRIDKIIESLVLSTDRLKGVDISWVHIGGGDLLSYMMQLADQRLSGKKINYRFLGSMSNLEVKKYIKENKVDFLINTSDSEGVPVSIMEAMSYGVPAIAPKVGGVPEIVSYKTGFLLKEKPEPIEISDAIVVMYEKSKEIKYRSNAKKKIDSDFNATKNYSSLIDIFLHEGRI
ncbi:glycosyltransferase [Castellaniella sp. S9]|uniref:glycosyltransferase n=1 Tax=Castellaniella sp. S9 TaxID=2993652 RepID=UPI0022B56498|nr:glycosyltransferase [Castellaniella sp. S9]